MQINARIVRGSITLTDGSVSVTSSGGKNSPLAASDRGSPEPWWADIVYVGQIGTCQKLWKTEGQALATPYPVYLL
jgi:hypothetical protein